MRAVNALMDAINVAYRGNPRKEKERYRSKGNKTYTRG